MERELINKIDTPKTTQALLKFDVLSSGGGNSGEEIACINRVAARRVLPENFPKEVSGGKDRKVVDTPLVVVVRECR